MLILSRREGQWITVVHDATGDTLRIRISHIRGRSGNEPPRCDLGFDDTDWRFLIDRPVRTPVRPPETPTPVHPFEPSP